MKPALQKRSAQTQRRIMESFEALLQTTAFEDVSVQQIVQGAGCSVGTFYGRFESKEALLSHLRSSVYEETQDYLQDFLRPDRWAPHSLRSMLFAQLQEIVALHSLRKGVMRAVILQARRSARYTEEARAFNALLVDRVCAVWLSKRAEIKRPNPQLAVRQAFMMMIGYLRETIIFGELWDTQVAPEAASEAISAAVYHFLTTAK